MSAITFRAVLALHGKSATGIEVPADVVERLGGGRRPTARVTLRDHSWTVTLGSMDGRTMIPVSAENRAAAGVAAGEVLDVAVVLDTAPRVLELPDDLAAALDADPALRPAFDALAPSRRKEHVRSIVDAKKPETRQRRLEAVVQALRG